VSDQEALGAGMECDLLVNTTSPRATFACLVPLASGILTAILLALGCDYSEGH